MKTQNVVSGASAIWVIGLALTCGLAPSTTSGDVVLNPPPDVDKPFVSNPLLPNDMTCWLATASNMLAAAGYGSGLSMQDRADDIYADMVAHWGTAQGGWPDTALTWWLNSTHNNHKAYPYKTVVPQGHKNQTPWLDSAGARVIGNHLRDWEYVGIVIYNANFYHAITVWGDEAALSRLTGNPAQIWVADSDSDAGGDIQYYVYDAYSATNGWRFNYDIPHPTIEGITVLRPVDTATDHTNTQIVVGSWQIYQPDILRDATDLHYKVSTDVDILSYRTEIDWPRPNNPEPPTIVEDNPRRHLTVDWDLGSDPVPVGKAVTITTSFVLPTHNAIIYSDVRWTYPELVLSRLPAFRWAFETPRLWDLEEVVENVTGGYVVGSFDLFTDAEGRNRVGRFRGLHEYDYFQDPEDHQFELASLEDGRFYVGNIRFGHSYGYLEGDALWDFDEWMSEYPAIQEFVPGQPIAIHLDWEGRLPYPMAPGPRQVMAINPSPSHRAIEVPADAVLSWTGSGSARTHDVYLGTVYADVDAANRAGPLNVLVSQGQDANTYDPPAPLALGQTYYWRIDEVEAAPASTIFKGRVWSFTVEPFSYPVTGVTVTASSSNADMGPERTIDRSGLNERDEHSTVSTDMWLSNQAGPQPTWIQYAFDKVYKLDQMWIWNSNQPTESLIGFGAKNVTIEYSTDGSTWNLWGDFEFARATGLGTYTPNTTLDFSGAAARYVKLTIRSNWGGLMPQYGLSEVRFFYVPTEARQPDPPAGATGVDVDAVLSWRSGREASSHEVWFATERQAVTDDAAPVATVIDHAFDPGPLTFGQTYYWKVAEVNEVATPPVWPGDLWSFTTREYTLVDDFESYTDAEGNRIYDTWIDGWTNHTGSAVGYVQPPFAERTIIHGGGQSMPFDYNNVHPPFYSEAEREFSPVQDWAGHGADTLSLWVRGLPANTPADLYVVVEDSGGKQATATHPTIVTAATWTEWKIPLSRFAGVNLSQVSKLTLGVGSRTGPKADGAGRLYIDDIGVGHPLPTAVTN